MITAASLLDAARTRGIFAVPTRSGEQGPVLLASLGVNMNSERDCADLLGIIRSGEIAPVECVYRSTAERSIAESLVGRGHDEAAALRLIRLSHLGDTSFVPDRWYHALLVEAVPTTAEGLTEDEIGEAVRLATDRERRNACRLATRAAYNDSRPALPHTEWIASRDRIAAAINHRRGIL